MSPSNRNRAPNPLPTHPCASHLTFTTLSSPTARLAATANHTMRSLFRNGPTSPLPRPAARARGHGYGDGDGEMGPIDNDPALDPLRAAEELAAIAAGAEPGFVGVSSGETYTGLVVVEDLWGGEEKREEAGREGGVKEMGGFVAEWIRDAAGWELVGFCDMEEARRGDASGGVGGVRSYKTTTVAVLVGSCWRHGWKVSISVGELTG